MSMSQDKWDCLKLVNFLAIQARRETIKEPKPLAGGMNEQLSVKNR